MKQSPITTHILNTSHGRPAPGVNVTLEFQNKGQFKKIGEGHTDEDGRVKTLLSPEHKLETGTYRLRFETGTYFSRFGIATFYPYVEISFTVSAPSEHYHVPLLLNPYGYSTYRGS